MDYADKLTPKPVVHFYAAAPVHNPAAVDSGVGMTERSGTDDERITLAQEAAEQLFNAKGSSSPSVYEPGSLLTARAAVRRLGELFEQLPGSVADALEAAGSSGELLSSDRLQGLAEILQNADDAGASEVRLLLRDDDLLMSHNGEGMRLRHVLGVAMPWFSTKRAESGSLGRFGIGLSALRSISSMIEVHCSPYHVRLGQPILSSIDPTELPAGFDEEGWTVFRVSLTEGEVELEELARWIERWGDAGLLFLRNVAQVTLRGSEGGTLRRLSVGRDAAKSLQPDGSAELPVVHRQYVETADGRSWIVYSSDVPSPTGVFRAHKKMEPATPVGVALPLHRGRRWSYLRGTAGRWHRFASVPERTVRSAHQPTRLGRHAMESCAHPAGCPSLVARCG